MVDIAQRVDAYIWASPITLQAIAKGNRARRSRQAIKQVGKLMQEAEQQRHYVKLVPWPADRAGAKTQAQAQAAAQEAAEGENIPLAPAGRQQREIQGVLQLLQKDRRQQQRDRQLAPSERIYGQYTWKLDQALPRPHILHLYKALTSEDTSVLVQARTGHNRLHHHLHRQRVVDSPECSCGQGTETVRHMILHCPQTAARSRLQAAAGQR